METSDSTKKKRASDHDDGDTAIDGSGIHSNRIANVTNPVIGIPLIFDDENSDNDIDILAAPPTKRTWSSFTSTKQTELPTSSSPSVVDVPNAARKKKPSTTGGLPAPFYSVMGDYYDSSTSSSSSGLKFSHTVIARMHIPFPTQLPEFISIIHAINNAMIHKQDWDIAVTCTLDQQKDPQQDSNNNKKKGFLMFNQGEKTVTNIVFQGEIPVRYEDSISSWNNDAPPTILVPGKRFLDELIGCCKSPNAKFNFGFYAVFTETDVHFKLPAITTTTIAAGHSLSDTSSSSSDVSSLMMSIKFANKFSLSRSIQQTAIGDHNIESENPVHPFHCDILRFSSDKSPIQMVRDGKSQKIQLLPQTRHGLLSLVKGGSSGGGSKKASNDADSVGKNDKVDVIVVHNIQNVQGGDETKSSSSLSSDQVICKQDLYLSCISSGTSTYHQTSFIQRCIDTSSPYSSVKVVGGKDDGTELSEWKYVKEALEWEETYFSQSLHSKSKQGRNTVTLGTTSAYQQLSDLTYPTVSLSRLVSILRHVEDSTRVEFIIPRSNNDITMLFISMTHDMMAPLNDVDDSSSTYDANSGFGKNRQSEQMFATGDTWNIICGLSCDDPCGDEEGDHDSKLAKAKADVMRLDSLMPSSTLNARGELPSPDNARTFDI